MKYDVKQFFPSDGGKRRECRKVLAETRLDEESGDYMDAVCQARYSRAKAYIEKQYLWRMEALEEEWLARQGKVLQLKQALAQLEEELLEGEWDDEI